MGILPHYCCLLNSVELNWTHVASSLSCLSPLSHTAFCNALWTSVLFSIISPWVSSESPGCPQKFTKINQNKDIYSSAKFYSPKILFLFAYQNKVDKKVFIWSSDFKTNWTGVRYDVEAVRSARSTENYICIYWVVAIWNGDRRYFSNSLIHCRSPK